MIDELRDCADCVDCERLVRFRNDNIKRYPSYHNKPVLAKGSTNPKLLIIGLAPGLHGANASGFPFHGDFSGRFLNECLEENGFRISNTKQTKDSQAIECSVTNAVKCLPPLNRPLRGEINNCLKHLEKEVSFFKPKAILCLGVVAHNSLLSILQIKDIVKFKHGNQFRWNEMIIFDSFHPSKLNVSTGRLSKLMFNDTLKKISKQFEMLDLKD